ncbi:nuclear transport factor 2 family protein [Rhodococcus sp. NPDC003322]
MRPSADRAQDRSCDPRSAIVVSEGDQADVTIVANRYAYALDDRNWPLLDEFFAGDAVAHYGDRSDPPIVGRAAIVRLIRSNLDGCGPTQHLMGNLCVTIDGDTAQTVCKARVCHFGAGERAGLVPYECFGVYRLDFRRTTAGWRVSELVLEVHHEIGDRTVLGPR